MLCLSHVGAWHTLYAPRNRDKVDTYENVQERSYIASLIDHTLLKAEATEADVSRVCGEARANVFCSVCVNPCWVARAADQLANSGVKVCTTIGFPLGANRSQTKLMEAELALADGATELDVVLNIGALRSGDTQLVRKEIEALANRVHNSGALLKVILEMSLLDDVQKRLACRLAELAGADFVKTSTGFSSSGATAADIRLMHSEVGDRLGIKASGGVRTLAALREMVSAGATRIGTSSGIQILNELANETVQAVATSDACRSSTDY